MSEWIALRIIDAAQEGGTGAGREKYKTYFISTRMKKYKNDVDRILTENGCGKLIYEEA